MSTICSKLHFNHLLLTTQCSKHQITLRRMSSLTSVLCMQKVFAFGWFGWYPLLMWPLMQTVCKVFLIYILYVAMPLTNYEFPTYRGPGRREGKPLRARIQWKTETSTPPQRAFPFPPVRIPPRHTHQVNPPTHPCVSKYQIDQNVPFNP